MTKDSATVFPEASEEVRFSSISRNWTRSALSRFSLSIFRRAGRKTRTAMPPIRQIIITLLIYVIMVASPSSINRPP